MAKKRPSTRFVTPHAAAHFWPRRTSMPSVFTAFVRGLQGEHTPDADLFHDAWHGLRSALASEMKKRGLWQRPPSYLGVYGRERWDAEDRLGDSAGSAAGAQVSALGELVADCYAFVFVDRLQGLRRRLADHPDIDGLVRLNIRHFLHERQRDQDPLGFRIFELLQRAVAAAVSRGALRVLAGDERIRNDTLLGFEPTAQVRAIPPDLEHAVRHWNDELLPVLITARSRQRAAVVERLEQRLLELPLHDVHAFQFKDLLDPLKRDARRRWAALLADQPHGGSAARAGEAGRANLAPPHEAVQSRRSLEQLTRCVSSAIDREQVDAHTRMQLASLWQYLRHQHGSDETAAGHDEGAPAIATPARPSYRQLARRLKMARARLPMLFATLRRLVAGCQASRSRMPDAPSAGAPRLKRTSSPR
jgi:hypothetical protein